MLLCVIKVSLLNHPYVGRDDMFQFSKERISEIFQFFHDQCRYCLLKYLAYEQPSQKRTAVVQMPAMSDVIDQLEQEDAFGLILFQCTLKSIRDKADR
jgi:hypothetical protein